MKWLLLVHSHLLQERQLPGVLVADGDSVVYRDIRELHRQAAEDLHVDEEAKAEMEQLLSELQQLLVGVSIMQDLTMRAKDSLVSFGERLSTRLFAAFLRHEVSLYAVPTEYSPRSHHFMQCNV